MKDSHFTLDASKNDTSLALDALRAIAAQMVCIGHGIVFFMPQLRQSGLPLPQNVGVLLFFVLSGFLISYTLFEKAKDPRYTFLQFFIDRAARIYSALIPCLIIVFVVDTLTMRLTGDNSLESRRGVDIFFANLLMLESYRGPLEHLQWLQWPLFGSASPLWTLVIEWHIYLFVGALFFIGATPRHAVVLMPIAILFAGMPLHYFTGALQADNGLGQSMFALWLGGAYIYVLVRTGFLQGRLIGLIVALASIAVYLRTARAYLEYDPRTYPLLVLFVLAIIVATQAGRFVVSAWPAKIVRFFASYSFTLYLIHHTLMAPAFLLWKDAGWTVFIPAVLVANIVSALLATQTEMRHKQLAMWLHGLVSRAGVLMGRGAKAGSPGAP